MLKKSPSVLARLNKLWSDKTFLKGIHILENLVSKLLALALVLVIFVSIFDLIKILSVELFTADASVFFDNTLIELFGLFLNILIALELMENITGYLKKHIIQVELVIVTALIAVARKIIIFDLNKFDSSDLSALSLAILALSASFWLVKSMNRAS
jgi:uncharacterized membrane protein (DUF373 family)